jgi:hypothetical protein
MDGLPFKLALCQTQWYELQSRASIISSYFDHLHVTKFAIGQVLSVSSQPPPSDAPESQVEICVSDIRWSWSQPKPRVDSRATVYHNMEEIKNSETNINNICKDSYLVDFERGQHRDLISTLLRCS